MGAPGPKNCGSWKCMATMGCNRTRVSRVRARRKTAAPGDEGPSNHPLMRLLGGASKNACYPDHSSTAWA
eukprot:7850679-Lingulodinium_polyedra.AAC.1